MSGKNQILPPKWRRSSLNSSSTTSSPYAVSAAEGEKSEEKIRQTEHASHHEVRREGLAQFSSVGNGIDDTFKTCSEVANEMLHDSNSFKLQIAGLSALSS